MIVRKNSAEETAKVDSLSELADYGKAINEGKANYLKDPQNYVPETAGEYAGVADIRAKESLAGEIYAGNASKVVEGKSPANVAIREAQKANEVAMEEGPNSPFQPSLAESTYGADYASAVRERSAERQAESEARSGNDIQEAKSARRAARARASEISSRSRDISFDDSEIKTTSYELDNPTLGA